MTIPRTGQYLFLTLDRRTSALPCRSSRALRSTRAGSQAAGCRVSGDAGRRGLALGSWRTPSGRSTAAADERRRASIKPWRIFAVFPRDGRRVMSLVSTSPNASADRRELCAPSTHAARIDNHLESAGVCGALSPFARLLLSKRRLRASLRRCRASLPQWPHLVAISPLLVLVLPPVLFDQPYARASVT